jgi:hypothetical protein
MTTITRAEVKPAIRAGLSALPPVEQPVVMIGAAVPPLIDPADAAAFNEMLGTAWAARRVGLNVADVIP